MLTNIIEENTELLYTGSNADRIIERAFHARKEGADSFELKGVVSRKKQFIPSVMAVMQDE